MQDVPPHRPRFLLVDGLRGLAAMAVLVFHFYEATRPDLRAHVPDLADAVLMRGWLGVQVFFVLSGFVIAYSIRGAHIDARYFGRFLLRRSIRLDPPYWASMLLAVIVAAALLPTAAGNDEHLPSFGQILAHLFYVQEILGFEHIDSVYWTLCLEIQFYCALVLLCALGQRGRSTSPDAPLAPWFLVLLAAMLGWSLAAAQGWVQMPLPGLFVPEWHTFFLGALTWWTLAGRVSLRWLVLALLATLAVRCSDGPHSSTAVGVLTAALLFVAGRGTGLATWLGGPTLQYLGRVSYSLYVLHPIVGYKLIRWIRLEHGEPLTVPQALGVIALALAVTLGLTHLFHHLVERPAVALSRRIHLYGARANDA